MLLQVHDELIFEVDSNKYDNLVNNVKTIMESVHLKYKNFSFVMENGLVAITNVGAYGSTLSSNYNTKPLASEILLKRGKIKIIRKRQKISEIIQ